MSIFCSYNLLLVILNKLPFKLSDQMFSVIGVNSAGEIYMWRDAGWVKLPGAAMWASIGSNDEV